MESFEFRFEDELFSRDGFFGEKMWEYRKGVVEYITRGRSLDEEGIRNGLFELGERIFIFFERVFIGNDNLNVGEILILCIKLM